MNRNAGVGLLLRDLSPQVLGAVARRHGDFDAAEDAVQDALIAALKQWPAQGIPSNPRGWLYRVAVRRLTDRLRSDLSRQRREQSIAADMMVGMMPPDSERDVAMSSDDALVLLFMCCHPSLTTSSAIALTLRAVGGLSTAEIASAFLVPEATMAQRISRAKQTIKSSGIPFSMPDVSERSARISAVLHVLYLIFNEGYTSSSGPALQRSDLAGEAIRLTRGMHELLPAESEATGLLSLMLLTEARRAARAGSGGELIPLDEQDRTCWDRNLIEEGTALVSEALSRGSAGPYQLQAAIAALHDEAAHPGKTDWPQIAALYTVLMRITDNPVVALNHAVAVAMVEGPQQGLDLVTALDDDARIAGHYRLDAVRGHLYERDGDVARAIAHYHAAAARTTSIPERNYLISKALRLGTANEA